MSLPDVTDRAPAVAARLLRWFEGHGRALPWRGTADPYRIWVSEVMLQQTRVDVVVPYYERFVARFPDLRSLAAADLDDVLKAWEGLGYYRRARNLKAASEQIVRDGGERLPDDHDALRALPGVGRYTAGAVMSLAHDRPYAAVDGNVRRVLCRLWAVGEDPRSADVERWLWDAAAALLPPAAPGRFNEAMMDLGATVCTDRRPGCGACPLRDLCDAYGEGDPLGYPRKPRRKAIPHVDVTAGIVLRDDADGGRQVLIARRRPEAMLGGLWEFPGGKLEPGETLEQCLIRELREELDIEIAVDRPFVAVDHAYSHFRITLHTFLCRLVAGDPRPLECDAVRWVRPAQLREHAFPKADRVVLDELERMDADVGG